MKKIDSIQKNVFDLRGVSCFEMLLKKGALCFAYLKNGCQIVRNIICPISNGGRFGFHPFCSVLCVVSFVFLSGCITTASKAPESIVTESDVSRVKLLTVPAWVTVPDDRERKGVLVDLNMNIPKTLRVFESRYGLPPWMIYGTVRALGMQRMWVNGDLKSYKLAVNGNISKLPEEDTLIYFVPEKDIHRALLRIVKDCSEAKDEEELNKKMARYIQCLYKDEYALFTLTPSDRAFKGGMTGSVEIFKKGRDDLPRIGWVTTKEFYETTVSAVFNPKHALESFQKAEELAIRDLVEGVKVKVQVLESVKHREGADLVGSKMFESAVKETLNLELRGVEVIRRAVDVEKNICLVAVRVPKSGIIVR